MWQYAWVACFLFLGVHSTLTEGSSREGIVSSGSLARRVSLPVVARSGSIAKCGHHKCNIAAPYCASCANKSYVCLAPNAKICGRSGQSCSNGYRCLKAKVRGLIRVADAYVCIRQIEVKCGARKCGPQESCFVEHSSNGARRFFCQQKSLRKCSSKNEESSCSGKFECSAPRFAIRGRADSMFGLCVGKATRSSLKKRCGSQYCSTSQICAKATWTVRSEKRTRSTCIKSSLEICGQGGSGGATQCSKRGYRCSNIRFSLMDRPKKSFRVCLSKRGRCQCKPGKFCATASWISKQFGPQSGPACVNEQRAKCDMETNSGARLTCPDGFQCSVKRYVREHGDQTPFGLCSRRKCGRAVCRKGQACLERHSRGGNQAKRKMGFCRSRKSICGFVSAGKRVTCKTGFRCSTNRYVFQNSSVRVGVCLRAQKRNCGTRTCSKRHTCVKRVRGLARSALSVCIKKTSIKCGYRANGISRRCPSGFRCGSVRFFTILKPNIRFGTCLRSSSRIRCGAYFCGSRYICARKKARFGRLQSVCIKKSLRQCGFKTSAGVKKICPVGFGCSARRYTTTTSRYDFGVCVRKRATTTRCGPYSCNKKLEICVQRSWVDEKRTAKQNLRCLRKTTRRCGLRRGCKPGYKCSWEKYMVRPQGSPFGICLKACGSKLCPRGSTCAWQYWKSSTRQKKKLICVKSTRKRCGNKIRGRLQGCGKGFQCSSDTFRHRHVKNLRRFRICHPKCGAKPCNPGFECVREVGARHGLKTSSLRCVSVLRPTCGVRDETGVESTCKKGLSCSVTRFSPVDKNRPTYGLCFRGNTAVERICKSKKCESGSLCVAKARKNNGKLRYTAVCLKSSTKICNADMRKGELRCPLGFKCSRLRYTITKKPHSTFSTCNRRRVPKKTLCGSQVCRRTQYCAKRIGKLRRGASTCVGNRVQTCGFKRNNTLVRCKRTHVCSKARFTRSSRPLMKFGLCTRRRNKCGSCKKFHACRKTLTHGAVRYKCHRRTVRPCFEDTYCDKHAKCTLVYGTGIWTPKCVPRKKCGSKGVMCYGGKVCIGGKCRRSSSACGLDGMCAPGHICRRVSTAGKKQCLPRKMKSCTARRTYCPRGMFCAKNGETWSCRKSCGTKTCKKSETCKKFRKGEFKCIKGRICDQVCAKRRRKCVAMVSFVGSRGSRRSRAGCVALNAEVCGIRSVCRSGAVCKVGPDGSRTHPRARCGRKERSVRTCSCVQLPVCYSRGCKTRTCNKLTSHKCLKDLSRRITVQDVYGKRGFTGRTVTCKVLRTGVFYNKKQKGNKCEFIRAAIAVPIAKEDTPDDDGSEDECPCELERHPKRGKCNYFLNPGIDRTCASENCKRGWKCIDGRGARAQEGKRLTVCIKRKIDLKIVPTDIDGFCKEVKADGLSIYVPKAD